MTRVSDPRHPLWLQCNRCAPVAFTTRPVRKNQDISSTATLDRDTGQYGLRLHALKLTESYCTCARISRVGSGGCRRCCLPTCPCLLGWRPAAAITLDRTKHDTFTYCDRQSHPFVGNPIRGRSGGGRCHGLCARVVLCFALPLPTLLSPRVPSPSLHASLTCFRFSGSLLPVAFHRRTFWFDLWLCFGKVSS